MNKFVIILIAAMSALILNPRVANAQAAAPPVKNMPAKVPVYSAAPSERDIAEAKAKGMVWTNPTTKVYHKDGEFYGRTKNGKFMTESDAQRQYYRPSPEAMKKAEVKTAPPVVRSVPPPAKKK